MLLEFKVSNYRSIGDEQIISLVPAARQQEYKQNILQNGKFEALNAVSIYGANASGKSNILQAMGLLDELIHMSARTSSTSKLPYEPFMLRDGWEEKPTSFEITFVLDEQRYRYGLEYNQTQVTAEWLFRKATGREVSLFQRQNDIIDATSGFKGSTKAIDAAIETTRDNALFLSMCDALNVAEAKQIFGWFRYFRMLDGLRTEDNQAGTLILWEDDKYRPLIREYIKKLNLGIEDIEITTRDFDSAELSEDMPEDLRRAVTQQLSGKKQFSVFVSHKTYTQEGLPSEKPLKWKMAEHESAGTQKVFHLSGPILWALVNGGVLIVDEIEAKMHPIMTLHTIDTFLNKDTNPNNAQIIFATHDTNLLSYSNLRRDQIYFTEKNKWESTEAYSLSDFIYIGKNIPVSHGSKERPDSDKEKRYFEGRYGAIPSLGNFNPIKNKANG